MKPMIFVSGVLHAVVVTGLVVLTYTRSEPVYFTGERIYSVDLVALPASMAERPRPRSQSDKPYKVVPKKDAAVPDKDASLALKRTPNLVDEEPEKGPHVPESFETRTGGVRLDVKSFEFPYYLAAIQRKIQQNFQASRLPGVRRLEAVVYFRIDRAGRVTRMEIEEDSGNPIFDLSARRALERSNPLPPLPDGFRQEYLGVHFEFAYVR